MKLKLVNGGADLQVSDETFGQKFNEALVHQVIVAYRNAGRSGTKAQKTKAEVRGGGSLSASTLLALGLLSVCLGGAALGAAIALPERRRALLAIAAATLPLAAACFHAGLEPTIVKYGQVFSAGQFLLSPDRANYLSPAALTMRFVLAWALAAALIALLQLRAWQALARRHTIDAYTTL